MQPEQIKKQDKTTDYLFGRSLVGQTLQNRYLIGELIGQGSYGQIFSCIDI